MPANPPVCPHCIILCEKPSSDQDFRCQRCGYRHHLPDRKIVGFSGRKRRMLPGERRRRQVQTLLNDDEYLALLRVSSGADLSKYVRDLINADIAKHEPVAETQTESDHHESVTALPHPGGVEP